MSSYVRLYIQGQMTQTMTFIFKRKNLKKKLKRGYLSRFSVYDPSEATTQTRPHLFTQHCTLRCKMKLILRSYPPASNQLLKVTNEIKS